MAVNVLTFCEIAEAKPEKSRDLMHFRHNRKQKNIFKYYFSQFGRYIVTFQSTMLFQLRAGKVEDNVPASRGKGAVSI